MRVQKTIGWLLALTPLLALFSCESDDMPDSQQGELVPVTIRLGVEGSGLATRAAEDGFVDVSNIDEDAISSVDVYIVNNSTGQLEHHLSSTNEGDFTDGTSRSIEVTTGTKRVYAVANYYSDSDPAPATVPENEAVNALSKISTTTIPMSADTTWNVNATGTYEVQLTRMVAQMKVSIVDDRKSEVTTNSNEKFSSLVIEDLLPDKTMLYRNDRSGSSLPILDLPSDATKTNWTWESPQIGNKYTKTFYLHETSSNSFTVKLYSSTSDDNPRTGYIPLTIPRNYVQPLEIHITNYSINFKVTTSLAAIGQIPVTKTQSGYSIVLPEGCTFTVKATAQKNTGENWASDASWTWTADNIDFLNIGGAFPTGGLINNNSFVSFSGKVSAIPTDETCQITVQLKDGDVNMTFPPIIISVRALQDGDASSTTTTTRSASSEAQPIIIEL